VGAVISSFLLNRFKSVSDNRRQSVFQWVFNHARIHAVAALDAFGLVYFDSVGPELPVDAGGRMGFIDELRGTVAASRYIYRRRRIGAFYGFNLQVSLFPFECF
jgi:hypothetical protein